MSDTSPISKRFDALIDARPTSGQAFRLGLFGGTFDPVHIGHLSIAERAREQFALDGVLFIPTGRPVRKALVSLSTAEERYAMLEAALAGNEHFDLSRIEIEREGATYTIDTLEALRRRYGNAAKLFFIAGADSTADISTWYRAEEIARLTEIISAPRMIPAAGEPVIVHNHTNGFIVHEIEAPFIDIASSGLRLEAQEGRSLRYLVPDAVCDYIERHGLYRR